MQKQLEAECAEYEAWHLKEENLCTTCKDTEHDVEICEECIRDGRV
jgi:hypothetical protein